VNKELSPLFLGCTGLQSGNSCQLFFKMPLKLIPNVLSPELLFVLASMGHGDEIG